MADLLCHRDFFSSCSSFFPPDRMGVIQELAFLDLMYEVESMRPGKEAETLKVLDGVVSGQANSQEICSRW